MDKIDLCGIIAAILATSGCATGPRIADELPNAAHLLTISVTMPTVEHIEHTMAGPEAKPEREAKDRKLLQATLKSCAQSMGYNVNSQPADSPTSIKSSLANVREQANLLIDSIKEQKRYCESDSFCQRRVDIDPQLQQYFGTDALLMSNLNGIYLSGGRSGAALAGSLMMGLLTGYAPVLPQSTEAFDYTLVDLASGDLLWWNEAVGAVGAVNLKPAKALASFPSHSNLDPAQCTLERSAHEYHPEYDSGSKR